MSANAAPFGNGRLLVPPECRASAAGRDRGADMGHDRHVFGPAICGVVLLVIDRAADADLGQASSIVAEETTA